MDDSGWCSKQSNSRAGNTLVSIINSSAISSSVWEIMHVALPHTNIICTEENWWRSSSQSTDAIQHT
jgi:hypothetical protein